MTGLQGTFAIEGTTNNCEESVLTFQHLQVETVGDCYVAVARLPDPRPDHAVIMARFARDCLGRTKQVVRKTEVELGPDTAGLWAYNGWR